MGGSSHWVAMPARSSDVPMCEFVAMTDDLNAMAAWLIACGVDGHGGGGIHRCVLDPGV